MIKSLGKHAVTAATVLGIGGLGAIGTQAPAHASAFTTAYTCNIANMGQTAVVLNGWLSSPTAFNWPARFQLHISSLSLQAPVPIQSWSANAWINVGGAENTTFQVSGSGGYVPPQGAISGDLAGDWAPAVAGTDLLSVGGIELMANSTEAGTVPIQCVPNGTSVAEVLRVAAPYRGRWIRPVVPGFQIGGWYRPGMALHRPVWTRPVRPGGWYHSGNPHSGGWNRPANPSGGWTRPGNPGHSGHPAGVPPRHRGHL